MKKLQGYLTYSIVGLSAGLTSIISSLIAGFLLILIGANRYVLSNELDITSRILWALIFLWILTKKDYSPTIESKVIKILLFVLFFTFFAIHSAKIFTFVL